MVFKTSVVPFQLQSGVGAGTLDIMESGFGTPQGALFFLSGSTNDSGTLESDTLVSVGMTDGTHQYVSQVFSQQGAVATSTSSTMFSDGVISESDAFDPEGHMSFNSFIADGVRLNYDIAFDKPYRGFSVLFTDPDNLELVEVAMTSDNKDVSLSGSFKPDFVLFLSTAGNPSGLSADLGLSIGYACRGSGDTITQFSFTQFIEDGLGNVATTLSIASGLIFESLSSSSSQTQIFMDEWRADGFGLTRTGVANAPTLQCFTIQLPSGYQSLCGTGDALTSIGTKSIITDFNQHLDTSELAFIIQTAKTGLGFDTTEAAEALSIGMVDYSGNQALCSWKDTDTSDTSSAQSAFVNSGLIHRYDGSSTLKQKASMLNMDSPDLDIDFTTINTNPDLFGWFVLQKEFATSSLSIVKHLSIEQKLALSDISNVSIEELSSFLKRATIPVSFQGNIPLVFSQQIPIEVLAKAITAPKIPIGIQGGTLFSESYNIPIEFGGTAASLGLGFNIPIEIFNGVSINGGNRCNMLNGCVQGSTKFNGVTEYGQTLLASHLEQNLKIFMDWAFLEIGAFTNVLIPQSGAWGGDFSNLRPVKDPSYTLGQVWETARQDWVYESGLCYTGGTPIGISGAYINGTFYSTGDATFGHHYSYPLGRVIFDSQIGVNSTVELSYSYRNVHTYRADMAPWWTELQYNSLRPDDIHFNQLGSGDWSILANHRVQLPAIVLEVVPRRTLEPYELGDLTQWVKQDVLFHILSESRWERNQLMDILSFQNDKTIWLFDANLMAEDEIFPLDFRGMLLANPRMYPDFVGEGSKYRWKKCQFTKTIISEVRTFNPRLHEGTVRTTLQVLWNDT